MTTQLWAMLLVVVSSVLGSISPSLLKKASERKIYPLKFLITNYPLYGAASLYMMAIFIFVFALKGGELTVLYPLSSLGYIWASLSSVRFLGERMSAFKWAGICLIIAGVTFIGIGSVA